MKQKLLKHNEKPRRILYAYLSDEDYNKFKIKLMENRYSITNWLDQSIRSIIETTN